MSPQKFHAVPRPRHRPPGSARLSRDRTHRWHNHADAAAQLPPPNFPPESANLETVSASSLKYPAPFFRRPSRAYQRILPLLHRKNPPPSRLQLPAQNGNSSNPP